MKSPRCLMRCVRCSCEWISDVAAGRVRCPLCGSWISERAHSSWIPLFILLLVALVTCYFLKHPQDLARLMGV